MLYPEKDNFGRLRTPFAVVCTETFDVRTKGCGLVYLTEQEYDNQMSLPNLTWRCPICRGFAIWQDINYEQMYEEFEQ